MVGVAELLISPVLQVLLDNLAICGRHWLSHLWEIDVKCELEKLHKAFDVIQCALEHAETQQAGESHKDTAAGILLSNFKDLAYEALFLLLDNERPDSRSFSRKYRERVKFVLSKLERAADKLVLELNTGVKAEEAVDWERRETSYIVRGSKVYGREQEKDNIVNLLLSDYEACDHDHVPCVIIEGMTAIGKTTLAQLAHNDEKVTQHFDVKVWVFVSHHFDAKKILTAVVECITNGACSFTSLSALHLAVEGLLRGKRYLIVLDDVCTENVDDWDKLRPLLGGSSTAKSGSRILITTQNKRVALALKVSKHFLFRPERLSEDSCWDILKQLAFQPGEEEKYPALHLIGRQIARKCGGVPLAAKSLGSLLRYKRNEIEWLKIQDNELWNLDEAESGILPALRLSYSRLPPELRRCFAFCSIFPQGYEIKREKLIRLWMAEGLIKCDDKNAEQAENTGYNYFNDLLWMSFFEEVKQHEDGIVTGYRMHDVIYNLARSVAKSEYSILGRNFSAPTNFAKIHHSSVVCDYNSPMIPYELFEAHGLLTLFLFSGGNFNSIPEKFYSSFQYLFVLDLSGSGVEALEGKFLSKLVHLKFLDLSYTPIQNLPREIGVLKHLQTLSLFHCYNLVSLNLAAMGHVIDLNNAGCEALVSMFNNVGRRRSLIDLYRSRSVRLERLPLFVVENSEDIVILSQFRLRGNLKITHLENVHKESHAKGVELIEMNGLESLGLFWGNDDHNSNLNRDEESIATEFRKRKHTRSSGSSSKQGPPPDPLLAKDILSNLHPPQFIKRLVIAGYPGIEFPLWEIPIYLNVIHLIGCRNVEHLPVLGQLSYLTGLLLQEMHSLRCIEREFYGKLTTGAFPALRELTVTDCPNFEKWSSPDDANAFPSLLRLILNGCPQLIEIPVHKNSINHLELRCCKATLVHSFRDLTSLKTLVIEGVHDLFDFPSPFPGNNPNLTSLEIISCSQLSVLPDEVENLTCLKSLTIRSCAELSFLPIRWYNLTALESLEISDCLGLERFPRIGTEGFRKLRTLYIENCSRLNHLPRGLEYLTSLEHLSIVLCSNLQAIPQSVEHLSSLRSLTIIGCDNLTSLPEGLQNLDTLHILEISYCPAIEALPEWIEKLVSLRSLSILGCENITFLPQGIKNLTALQHLSIHDCPQLLKRCSLEGEDWPKIAHVPHQHLGPPKQRHQSEAGSSSSA